MKILIIDDSIEVTTYLKRLLIQVGYDVIVCNEAECGLDLVRKDPGIKLILLDVMMPKMDGNKFLEEYSKLVGKPPVIVMSGYIPALKEDLKHIPVAELQKPFENTQLLQEINRWMNKDG